MVAQISLAFIKARPGKLWPRLLAYTIFEGRPLTTRGRWINHIVFALYRFWSVCPFPHGTINPIFILGMGRSGTTVLGSILSIHRDVGYLNEPKALWHAALGDDDLIGSYARNPGRYRMTEQDVTPGKIRLLNRFYSAFLLTSRCKRIVDKYPEMVFRTKFLDAVFPGVRKVVLIRNGLDVCRSVTRWSGENKKTTRDIQIDWWGHNRRKWTILVDELVASDPELQPIQSTIRDFSRQTDMAAVEWIVTMREIARLKSDCDDTLHIVRYEDLLANPASVLSGILDFCGLASDQTMLDFGSNILRSPQSSASIILDPAIEQIFYDTMVIAGYDQQRAA
ncbi:MAG: sulfotransferase family protein [Paracoccaceae bacterium]